MSISNLFGMVDNGGIESIGCDAGKKKMFKLELIETANCRGGSSITNAHTSHNNSELTYYYSKTPKNLSLTKINFSLTAPES